MLMMDASMRYWGRGHREQQQQQQQWASEEEGYD